MDTMMDYINECLCCESMSYVIEENKHELGYIYRLYECENCGFQWEVIEIGNGKRSL